MLMMFLKLLMTAFLDMFDSPIVVEQGLVAVFGSKDGGFPMNDISESICGDSQIVPCPSKVVTSTCFAICDWLRDYGYS